MISTFALFMTLASLTSGLVASTQHCDAPSGLRVHLHSEAGDPILTWTAPAGEVWGYNVYRSEQQGVQTDEDNLLIEGMTRTDFYDHRTRPQVTYYYKVAALKSRDASPLVCSQEVSITSQKRAYTVEGQFPILMGWGHSGNKEMEDIHVNLATSGHSPDRTQSVRIYDVIRPPHHYNWADIPEVKAEIEMKVGIYHSTYALAQRWAEVVEDFNLDGSIWGYQFNCRPLAQPSHLLPRLVEEKTGKPTLSLEMDYYDSRSYSAASMRTRVETFAEMLRARKVSSEV